MNGSLLVTAEQATPSELDSIQFEIHRITTINAAHPEFVLPREKMDLKDSGWLRVVRKFESNSMFERCLLEDGRTPRLRR